MKLKSLSELKEFYDGMLEAKQLPKVNLCNCTGPQKGEKLCTCAKRAEEIEYKGRSGG